MIITLFAIQCLLSQALAHYDCLNVLYDFSFSSDEKMSFDFVLTKGTQRGKLEFSFQGYLLNGVFRFCSGVLQGRLALEKSKLIFDEQRCCWEMVTNHVVDKKMPLAFEPAISLSFSEYRDGGSRSISYNASCPTNSASEVFGKVSESYSNFYATVNAGVGTPDAALYQSSGETSEGPSLISFSDAFYTPFKYLRREVVCQGVLKKDDVGYFYLCPTNDELCGIDHLAHVQKLPRIHLEVPGASQKMFDSHTGMTVSVSGTLSSLGDENVGQHELESGFVCLQSPKVVPDVKSLSRRTSSSSCFYASPCLEFKLKLHTSDGFICLVHYYSARLWVARYAAKTGAITVSSVAPQSVYATRKDQSEENKMAKLWRWLAEMEVLLRTSGCRAECSSAGMVRSNPYTEISEIELYGEKCLKLQSTVLEMFEDLGVGFPGTGLSSGTDPVLR